MKPILAVTSEKVGKSAGFSVSLSDQTGNPTATPPTLTVPTVEDSSTFLSYHEKQNVVNWTYRSIDNSISTQLLTVYWDVCLALVPENVAPNVLTLGGLLCLIQSTVLTQFLYESRPFLTTLLNIALIFSYQALDAIDGKQARKTKSGSPVGELFDHICDAVGLLFIVRTVCLSLGIDSIWTQYLIINITGIQFMKEHLEAFIRKDRVVEFPRYTGPGEILLATLSLLFLNAIVPLKRLLVHFLIDKILFIVLIYVIARFVTDLLKTDFITRDTALLCFFLRFMAVYLFFDWLPQLSQAQHTSKSIPPNWFQDMDDALVPADEKIGYELLYIYENTTTIYLHGLFWTIMTGDLIVSKMAKRKLHPIMPIFALLSSISIYTVPISFGIYFYSVFNSLLNHMNLAMFRIN